MTETELKFAVNSFTKIRERLNAIDARLVWKGMEETQYYDLRGETLRHRGISLRMRDRRGYSTVITCKQDLADGQNAKRRNEFEFEVENKKQIEGFLYCLDLVPVFFYKKKREHWEINKRLHVELDELEDGRRFVEIEGSERNIEKIAKVLDVYGCPRSFESYPQILKLRKKK